MDLQSMALVCRTIGEAGSALRTYHAIDAECDGVVRFAIRVRITIPDLATLTLASDVVVAMHPLAPDVPDVYAFVWTPAQGSFPVAVGTLRITDHADGCALIATAACPAPPRMADRRLAFRIGQATLREMLRDIVLRVETAPLCISA